MSDGEPTAEQRELIRRGEELRRFKDGPGYGELARMLREMVRQNYLDFLDCKTDNDRQVCQGRGLGVQELLRAIEGVAGDASNTADRLHEDIQEQHEIARDGIDKYLERQRRSNPAATLS